jgi:dolichyl-phosphate-mannose-protein mannosyltransferase
MMSFMPRRPSLRAAPVAVLLLGALVLRLWGVRHGLPYSYNSDEDAHFVPGAIGLFGHGWNPHYFVNPPAFTYGLHVVFAVAFGGGDGAGHAYATDPGAVFTAGRVASAVLGTAAVAALYAAGARLWNRATGLLAGGVMAVAFLPVFYSHMALNDVPATLGVALALWGAALALDGDHARIGRGGGRARRRAPGNRAWPWVLAGAGAGLAAATKYTGGIALVAVLGAAWAARRPRGAVLAVLCAAVAFVAADPYALLDLPALRHGLSLQQDYSSGAAAAKLGIDGRGGLAYYAWTLTWGLGWVPALAAVAGAVLLLARDRAGALVLVPAPVLFLAYMGAQDRYFGRWLLPIVPILALLAAHAAVTLVRQVPLHRRLAAFAVAAVVLLAQGTWTSVASDRKLSRADSRNQARAWMVAHVPAGARIVVEPVVPLSWLQDPGAPRRRWTPWTFAPPPRRSRLRLETFELALRPGLIDAFRRHGYCWVLTGSTQRGRARVAPGAAPAAVAYYAALERASASVVRFSPYRPGATPVAFNFDWSFDYYPRAYDRPGAVVAVHRLRDCHPYPEPGT